MLFLNFTYRRILIVTLLFVVFLQCLQFRQKNMDLKLRITIPPFSLKVRAIKTPISVDLHQFDSQSNISKRQPSNVSMNFALIIVFFAACISSARLGLHGSKYHYGQFGNLSPQQVAIMKKILKIECQRKHGRFC